MPETGRRRRGGATSDELEPLDTVADLAELVSARPGLFVRWSQGPHHDAGERSTDFATGLELPGLAVNPLTPPTWWTLPVDLWVARKIREYAHLSEASADHLAWVLAGRIVERGPDNEPLVVDVEPVALLPPSVLREAADLAPSSSRS